MRCKNERILKVLNSKFTQKSKFSFFSISVTSFNYKCQVFLLVLFYFILFFFCFYKYSNYSNSVIKKQQQSKKRKFFLRENLFYIFWCKFCQCAGPKHLEFSKKGTTEQSRVVCWFLLIKKVFVGRPAL